jgi:tetratricopeptide (TPR) repeat protein
VPFTGRGRELAELRSEITRPGLTDVPDARSAEARCRVLLVAGRPGSGRTALAVRLAREVADDYPDGAFFVPLTAPGGAAVPPDTAARALLGALGRPSPAGPEGAACAALRAALAGRRAVLVLDDVHDAAQLERLLPAEPGCLVVAVGSRPLTGVPDVRPCVLGGLDLDAAVALLAALAGETRLAVDPVAARRLAEALDCHPTALRLVGGWLRTRPRASVTDALHRLFEPPRPGAKPDDAEPATEEAAPGAPSGRPGTGDTTAPLPPALARAFATVYAELGGGPARLLRLALLAPGGAVDARLASALAGCPVEDAAASLTALGEQQLLAVEEGRAAPHYRVPRCLRPALRALLDQDRANETQLARARMLERMVRLLGAAVTQLTPGPAAADPEPLPPALRYRTRAQAWDWLDGSLPDLRLAAREAVAEGGLDGTAARLLGTLVRAVPLHHGLAFSVDARRAAAAVSGELYELHSLMLELARRGGMPRREAAALVNLGDLHAAAGRHREALERYRAALGPARGADDGVAVGRILEAVAGAYGAAGDPVRAADWYRRALAFRRNRGESRDETRLLLRLAAVHAAYGPQREALREYRAAAANFRRLGDLPGEVAALLGAARALESAGEVEPALRTGREALAAARRAGAAAGRDRLETGVLLWLADALERAGDPTGARIQREQAAAPRAEG